jgi:azurin
MAGEFPNGASTMNTKITFLAAACALALAACGDKSAGTTDTAPASTANTPAATDTMPAGTPADTGDMSGTAEGTTVPGTAPGAAPADAATPAASGSDKPAAVVTDCATEIEGTDAMQYNVGSITIPASCTEFKITLKHPGTLPVAAMGHNVVIAAMSDMKAVAADGVSAGLAADYVKPGDTRVIAHTKMIGGGESTSVSFPVSKLKSGGPYEFFCSFPGHSAVMKGVIAVE